MPREFAFPGTRDRYAPSRVCDVQHYCIELDLDVANKSIKGKCTLSVSAIGKPRLGIELDAVELDVLRVTSWGVDLSFHNDGRRLRVDFDDALALGEIKELVIEYQTTPRRGLYFVGPDAHYPDKPLQVWSQGQDVDSRYWFPCFDSPHQKSTSEVIVTIPDTWYALSNGVLMRDKSTAGRRTMHWRLDVPHACYLITLAAGEFAEIRDHWQDVEVNYYSHPSRIEDCRRTVHRTPEMIELFSDLFGVRYPYNKYAQVFVADFIFGGMENTTATSLTDSLLIDERAALDYNVESLVAHELAHQWFGNLLTCRDWGEGWLHEGFATYSEYLWREHAEGRDAAALELAAFSRAYLGEDRSRYRRAIVTKRYEAPLDIFDRHLYDKAGRVVHMLRRVLGDEDFFAALRFYLDKHRTAIVETRDLARAIEESRGRNLDWFFDQWVLRGSGHPHLKVQVQWSQEHRVLSIQVEQVHAVDDKTPLFRLPTEILLVFDGESQIHQVEVRETSQVFTFACAHEPVQAIFDPGKHLLCEVTTEKPPAMWLEELQRAEEGADRIDAAGHCAILGGRKMEAALIHGLSSDPFWGVRQACAEKLGTMRLDNTRDALITALAEAAHPRVRRSAAQGLSHYLGDELAAQALRDKIEAGDASYFVEAECCASLGAIRAKDGLAILKEAATRPAFMDIIQQRAYQGMAALGDPQATETLLAGMAYGQPGFARRAAMRALANLCAEQSRDTRPVREAFIVALRDPDFRVRMEAITSLESLGQAQAAGALQDIVDTSPDSRMRRRAREAVRNLKEARRSGAQISELRDQGEALRKELAQLRSRLDAVETARNYEKQGRQVAASMQGIAPTPQRRKGGKKSIPV